jgi:UDP-GlcNAc:undecaprenyl-phosphate GlcNAc-1-phosphate transferase
MGIVSLLIVLNTVHILRFNYRFGFLILLSFCISFLLTPLACRIAERLGVMDEPNERKIHTRATPLLGGAPIFIAFFLSTVITFWYSNELKGVIFAATVIFLIGLLDDIFGLSSIFRLLAQLFAVFILFWYGMELEFIPDTTTMHLFKKAVTVIWIIGITNAVNFLDGLDGLCVGFGAIASIAVGIIAFLTHQYFLMFLSFSLAGSCLGFLPWNFRRSEPARIFMGSAGSLFIGFTLAAFAIMGEWAENRVVALSVPVLILFLPIFDTSMTTFFRIREGKVRSFREWLDYVGKDHLHHRVYAMGIGKRKAVFVLYMFTFILGISAIIIRTGGTLEAWLSLIQAGMIMVFFVAFSVYVKSKHDAVVDITQKMNERTLEDDPPGLVPM